MTLDDDKLDAMLRSCGEEARTASHRMLESGLDRHRESAVKRAAAEALRPRPLWQRLIPRPSGAVFSPFSGVAVACVLMIAFVMTLNMRTNEPRPKRFKTPVAVNTALSDDETDFEADGDLLAAYRGLSGSTLDEDDDFEIGDEDDDSLPDYYSLDLETVQTDYSEEEDNAIAFEDAA